MNTFSPGNPYPLGGSLKEGVYNFALFSEHAEEVAIGFFKPNDKEPFLQIPLQRTGSIWHIALSGLDASSTYAFHAKGPSQKGFLYNFDVWLADPYAKEIDSPCIWNEKRPQKSSPFVRALLPKDLSFDWQGVKAPQIQRSELIIYEAHVRGFTRDDSSKTSFPGTYLALIEKIPHLKRLGVNAIELMPMFEFDETHSKNIHPQAEASLPNYWGYNSLHFFVPMRRFAAKSAILEFKTLVRELHRNGILVLLDVVYNHTGEGKEKDYYVHFRGLDNSVYYQLLDSGEYRDDTGCGHNVNANHPQVQQFILDSLRYWAEEFRVDGFRFDLCAALLRGSHGEVLKPAPLIEAIEKDPVLSKKILISEAWDASGLYLLGHFSNRGNWHEWNGQYRDHVRRFLKGTDDYAGAFATAISGSQPLYGPSKTPLSSINFVTCHDGYSLRDLVSYQQKHNMENGENNRDGADHNDSWNCGIEGAALDPKIVDLRERQIRNFLLTLFLSQGIPLMPMGDEYGHTRNGNNNPYVQDNALNWFLWDHKREDIVNFVSMLTNFRKKHPCFRKDTFLTDQEITWHGKTPNEPDWSVKSRFVAFNEEGFYVAFNADHSLASLELPQDNWHLLIDTSLTWQDQPLLEPQKPFPLLASKIEMLPHSAFVAERKAESQAGS